MAISALHSAATGLSALSQNLDVIANNLANVNTTGFKTSRANFEDLLYVEKRQPGLENANGDRTPAGLFVGLGTRLSNTQFDFSQGALIPTANNTDLAIDGQGLFKVTIPDSVGGGVGYTRSGNFMRNSEGELVLGNSDGPRLEPPIQIPQDALQVSVSSDGRVYAQVPGNVEPEEVGRVQLAMFVNPTGLKPVGGNLFVESAASGPPIEGNPSEGSFGRIIQSHLEGSNVDAVNELVSLIKTQRSFEMNSQTIQAADQSLQVISNLRRF